MKLSRFSDTELRMEEVAHTVTGAAFRPGSSRVAQRFLTCPDRHDPLKDHPQPLCHQHALESKPGKKKKKKKKKKQKEKEGGRRNLLRQECPWH